MVDSKLSDMIGLILAAGAGRRLRPSTDTLPKALVPVDEERGLSVVDLTLANFAEVGLSEAAIVVGYRAETVHARKAEFEDKYGVKLHLVTNDKAEEWNNAYSLWCARDYLKQGVILANGDTVHPVSVERTLFAARSEPGYSAQVLLALDTVKQLADEEMKVIWSERDGVKRITKLMNPANATGEYIGVTLIEASAAAELVDALEVTFNRDPQLYYEDGYQELVDRGFRVDVAPIGEVSWVEIDNHEDLAKARAIVAATRTAA
jgi:choline kinase